MLSRYMLGKFSGGPEEVFKRLCALKEDKCSSRLKAWAACVIWFDTECDIFLPLVENYERTASFSDEELSRVFKKIGFARKPVPAKVCCSK